MNTAVQASELHEDAQLVVDVMNEKESVVLDFSPDSISWLDTYINMHREELDENDMRVLRDKFGAYLGEAIRRTYGGEWKQVNREEWAIEFDSAKVASPFDIVDNHLKNQNSMVSLYQRIPELFDLNANRN